MIAELFEARTTKSPAFYPMGDITSPLPKESSQVGTNYLILAEEDVTTPCHAFSSPCLWEGSAVVPAFAVRMQGDETSHFRDLYDLLIQSRVESRTLAEPSRPRRNRKAAALLASWLESSESEDEEHRETLEFLVRALDEDRPSDRKLFP